MSFLELVLSVGVVVGVKTWSHDAPSSLRLYVTNVSNDGNFCTQQIKER